MIVGGKIIFFSILISLVTFFFFIKYIFVLINRLFLMDLDKSWIDLPRNTQQYMDGLNKFLDFAFANKSVEGKIICPCRKCNLKMANSRSNIWTLNSSSFSKRVYILASTWWDKLCTTYNFNTSNFPIKWG